MQWFHSVGCINEGRRFCCVLGAHRAARNGAGCPWSMIYSSVPVPEASLREALLVIGGAMVELAELVELGAVEVVQLVAEVLKLLVDGRDNERRVKIKWGALEKNYKNELLS